MTSVGVVLLARDGANVQAAALEALEPASDRAVTFVVMGGGALPAGSSQRPWPVGSGTAYAVNAGVEALLASRDVQVVVTLSVAASWPADIIDRLRSAVAAGADLVMPPGALTPFSAAAFTVSAWRQVGGVEEGYVDVLSDADFARAVTAAGGVVREIAGVEAADETWPEPSPRVRVRNEFIFRSRWDSSIRLWAWTASQLIRTVGAADARGQVAKGLLDGMSWRHTRKLMGGAA